VSPLFTQIHTNNIENLWKQIKQQIRKDKITRKYIPAIARFYFFKRLSKKDQLDTLTKGLKNKTLRELDELSDIVINKF